MASLDFTKQLTQAEKSEPSQRSDIYNTSLSRIITEGSTHLPPNLIAYVQSILSDSIGVIHSRPLLSSFVDRFRSIDDPQTKIDAGTEIVALVAPRIVSYEQQDTDLKYILADAYESTEDFVESAKTLETVTVNSSQRTVTDDDKAKLWMRICRCYLEVDDDTNALAYLNKVKQVIYSVTDQPTRLQFQLSQARIHDSQRNFLDASTAFLALSTETLIDEDERLQALSAAITTAVLAPAGPARARQLGKIYKDDRAAETPEYSILQKIFLDRLLAPAEVSAFAAGLKEHQLAKTSDGSTVLDRAVLEHNLLSISRLYQNISTASLGALLGVDGERAEQYAAAMIESKRLVGSIDQISEVIWFGTREGGQERAEKGRELRMWDAGVQGLAEEVERVMVMLQREEKGWFEGVVAGG
ncbi:hypothetical protein LTR62_005059 [Meristemomyces frigidus]|uniref:COP9 signalosome complex subunit 4 n=1 Tax=Meristemomyces frigidus TaxID=1508187 RepID=A0AAN7TPB6_9PEZI|nr:hypothetical protein LTR62_005059 [Meristemomyces frigidus]